MKKVKLNMKEKYKYDAIKNLVDHGGNKKRVIVQLGITPRHLNRLIKNYKENGKSTFSHGNREKASSKRIDNSLSDRIIQLYSTDFKGFNFSHFREMLLEHHNIKVSYTYIYKLLTNNGFLSPKAERKTKRNYARKQLEATKMLENKDEETIEIIVNREVELALSHPRQTKPKYFGEVIEMDASNHIWFGTSKYHLHLAIDKATSTVVGAHFEKQETLKGYYDVFNQILTNYGIPAKFFTDNRTVFAYNLLNPSKKTSEKAVLTQFGYACNRLGVDLETSSVPQAKGTVERANGTFQDRLVNELAYFKINSYEEANKYLKEVFIPKYNEKFSLNYKKFDSVFVDSPSTAKINYTLAVLSERVIDNGNSIKYNNNYYIPYENGKLICCTPKTKCLVIKALDGQLLVSIGDKVYNLEQIEKNAAHSEEFDTVTETPKTKEKTKYIPPMSHPWKAESFNKYINSLNSKKNSKKKVPQIF